MFYLFRTGVQTFRREHDRFWAIAAHPTLNLFAAGVFSNKKYFSFFSISITIGSFNQFLLQNHLIICYIKLLQNF